MRIRNQILRRAAAPLSLLLLAGCMRSKEKDFKPVQEMVAERSGMRVQWITGSKEDEEVRLAVEALLKDELTAASATQIALLNNRDLQATFEELGIAQADLVQAGLFKNPTLGFSFNYLKNTGGNTAQGLEFEIAQDFLNFILMPLRKRAAKEELEKMKMRVADEALHLAAETQEAFYTLQARMHAAETQRMAADADEAAADLARRQLDAGNISELDYSNHFTAYLEAKTESARLEMEIRADRERLHRLMGVWGAQAEWRVAPKLPDLPAEEPTISDVEAAAIARRLDLEVARREVEKMRFALKLAKWERIPPFSLGFHYERGNLRNASHQDKTIPAHHHDQPPVGHHSDKTDTGGPGGGGGGSSSSSSGGKIEGPDFGYDELVPSIEIELPIFDQGQARIARARAELRQAENKLWAMGADIRSEAREARDRMMASRKMAEFYRDVLLPERQKALVLAQVAYNGMHLGTYDLLMAKQMELKSHREYIESLRDYWTARAELSEAIGGDPAPPKMEEPAAPDAKEEQP